MEQRVNTLAEKVARMEAQLEAQSEAMEVAHDAREELKQKMDESNRQLHELLQKIAKWEGKFGGVLFIIGCLWAFMSGALKAGADWIKIKGDM